MKKQATLDTLSADISSLTAVVGKTHSDINGLTTRVDNLTTNVDNLTVNVNGLTTRVDNLTTNVDNLTTNVNDIMEFLRDHMVMKEELKYEIDAVRRDMATKDDLVNLRTEFQSGMHALEDRLIGHIDGFAKHNLRFESELAAAGSRISRLEEHTGLVKW